MAGADYERDMNAGLTAMGDYGRGGPRERFTAAEQAFTRAAEAADAPDDARRRAAAWGNRAGLWYQRHRRTGEAEAIHAAVRDAARALLDCPEERGHGENLGLALRACQERLPDHTADELTALVAVLNALRERSARAGGALDFTAALYLALAHQERLRRTGGERDHRALAEAAEATARIAVAWQLPDAAHHLAVAAAQYRGLEARCPGEGHAERAFALSTDALSRFGPGTEDHRRQSHDWALTGLMCLSLGRRLPDEQLDRLLPLLREAASGLGNPGLVTDGLRDWWESGGRGDDRATHALLVHTETECARLPEDDPRLPMVLNLLGSVLHHRFAHGTGIRPELDRAVGCFRRVLELTDDTSPERRAALANLAVCRLATDGRDDEAPEGREEPDGDAPPHELVAHAWQLLNSAQGVRAGERGERALRLLERARAATEPGTHLAASVAQGIGAALLARHRHTPGTLALGHAMDALEREAAAQPDDSPNRAVLLLELASCWAARYEFSGSALDLEDALLLAREARPLMPPGPRLVESTRRLGALLLRQDPWSAEGLRLVREAAEPDAGDTGSWSTAADWARAAAGQERWDEARTAARLALRRCLVRAADRAATPHARLESLEQARGLAVEAALVAVRAGDPRAALRSLDTLGTLDPATAAEGGPRARSAAGTPGAVPGNVRGGEATPPPPPEGCVLVHLCTSPENDLLALAVDATGGVRPLWLPVARRELVERAGLALLALGDEHDPAWPPQVVEELGGWLGERLVRPLLTELRTPWLCVVPHGSALGALPLHAAWWPDPSAPDGRRYALDEALITYANAAGRPGGRPDGPAPRSILAVADPEHAGAAPLPGARREAEHVVRHFGRHTLLTGPAARRPAVLEALAGSDVVHLAAHSVLDVDQPMRGGVRLADGELLALRELVAQPLNRIRLMVLATCSLGQAGRFTLGAGQPGSLPDALLHAGVGGIVSSLWPTPDESSALLLSRFYELWATGTRAHPAEALRSAQRWLREATNEELGGTPPAAPAARAFWARTRPYQHPVHWAAFSYAGA